MLNIDNLLGGEMRKIFRTLGVLLLVIGTVFNAAALLANDDLLSVHFSDADHGWAVGRWGGIIHTADGGQTWLKQTSGTDHTLTAVFFVDSNTGWAAGEQGTILHTTNGGKTWSPQKSPMPYFLMGAYFTNASTGWIVGERTHILYTRDGGKNWSVQFSDEDFILKSISFADEQHGWAVGEFGFIYATKDGGDTWELQAGEFGFSEETGEMIGGNYLFDVTAISSQEVWAVGIEGHITYSKNGGDTWSSPANIRKGEHLLGITSDKHGTLVTTGIASIYMSSDNGRSWQKPNIDPPISYGWLYGVAPRGEKGFVTVGKGGWIYLADATESTWQLSGK